MQFYVIVKGEQEGPYTPQQIRGYLNMGHLHPTDMAWHEGLPDWRPLRDFPEFAPRGHRTPNYAAMAAMAIPKGPKRKIRKQKRGSPVATIVLVVLLLGAAGAGGWYYWKKHQEKVSAAKAAEEAAAAAAAKKVPAGTANAPTTLAGLNSWYAEPAAGQNAATFFQQGFLALQITESDKRSYTLPVIGRARLPQPNVTVPGGMKSTLRSFLERNQPAIVLFDRGAKCSGCRYPVDLTKGMAIALPHLPKVKEAAEMGELTAISQSAEDNSAEAGKGVLLALAAARTLEAEPLLISQLVRVGCQGIAIDSLEQTVNRIVLPAGTLTQLQAAFKAAAESEASGIGFNRALVSERIISASTFDLPPQQLQQLVASTISQGRQPSAAETAAQEGMLKDLKDQRQYFEDTLNQVLEARVDSLPGRLKADDTVTQRAAEAATKGYALCAMFLPSLSKVTSKEAASLAHLRIAQTAVALERFRAGGRGAYPNSLNELAPKILESVPADPFDGKPLRYRKFGEGYVLYSVGPDLKDDGGARRPGSDDLLFYVAKAPTTS